MTVHAGGRFDTAAFLHDHVDVCFHDLYYLAHLEREHSTQHKHSENLTLRHTGHFAERDFSSPKS